VTTIENDRQTAALAARGDWPSFVSLRYGEALGLLAEGGTYDLIFADAPDGKWHGLDRTIAALGPHGMLVVDDMTPLPGWPHNQRAGQDRVRHRLLTAPQLIAVELAHGSGVILSTRR
jgi:predicted O-methyltransferase YrrM